MTVSDVDNDNVEEMVDNTGEGDGYGADVNSNNNINNDLYNIDSKYKCGSSGTIMTDPVIASNGMIYDRANIEYCKLFE